MGRSIQETHGAFLSDFLAIVPERPAIDHLIYDGRFICSGRLSRRYASSIPTNMWKEFERWAVHAVFLGEPIHDPVHDDPTLHPGEYRIIFHRWIKHDPQPGAFTGDPHFDG